MLIRIPSVHLPCSPSLPQGRDRSQTLSLPPYRPTVCGKGPVCLAPRTPWLESCDFGGCLWLPNSENKGWCLFIYFLKYTSLEKQNYWARHRKRGHSILDLQTKGYCKCLGSATLWKHGTLSGWPLGCPELESRSSAAPSSTCALHRLGKLQLAQTLQFFPDEFVFRAIASEGTLIQARCVGVLCVYVGKMDQAHQIILQSMRSQPQVTISSRYRPWT